MAVAVVLLALSLQQAPVLTAEPSRADTVEWQHSQAEQRLLLLTGVLAAVGALQLFVFGYQAFKLKQSVGEMKASTDTINRNATVELRAYLAVMFQPQLVSHPSVWAGGESELLLTIRNTGKTPARSISTRTEYTYREVDWVVREGFENEVREPRGMLPAGGDLDTLIRARALTDLELRTLTFDSTHALFLYVMISYTDAFGVDRWTRFTRKLTWLNGITVAQATDYGNDFT